MANDPTAARRGGSAVALGGLVTALPRWALETASTVRAEAWVRPRLGRHIPGVRRTSKVAAWVNSVAIGVGTKVMLNKVRCGGCPPGTTTEEPPPRWISDSAIVPVTGPPSLRPFPCGQALPMALWKPPLEKIPQRNRRPTVARRGAKGVPDGRQGCGIRRDGRNRHARSREQAPEQQRRHRMAPPPSVTHALPQGGKAATRARRLPRRREREASRPREKSGRMPGPASRRLRRPGPKRLRRSAESPPSGTRTHSRPKPKP